MNYATFIVVQYINTLTKMATNCFAFPLETYNNYFVNQNFD